MRTPQIILLISTIIITFILGIFFQKIRLPAKIKSQMKISLRDLRTDKIDINIDTLRILIKNEPLRTLNKKREEAIKRGVLLASDKDWVKGKLVYNKDTLSMKIRLKGTLIDHWLDKGSCSYKINITTKEKRVLGMKRFALQHPRVRNYMNEWVFP